MDGQVAVGDAAGDLGRVIRLAAQLLDQAARNHAGGHETDYDSHATQYKHSVEGFLVGFFSVLA